MAISRRTDAFTADEVCAILGRNLRTKVLLMDDDAEVRFICGSIFD